MDAGVDGRNAGRDGNRRPRTSSSRVPSAEEQALIVHERDLMSEDLAGISSSDIPRRGSLLPRADQAATSRPIVDLPLPESPTSATRRRDEGQRTA